MTYASVILCVRNAAATVAAQLDALAAQDCTQPWELLVVDNGSTDGTSELVQQWTGRIPGLRIVAAADRPGLAYARNFGAGVAEGELLVFCDADDVADRHWLQALFDGAQDSELVGGRLELGVLNDHTVRYWRGMSEDDLSCPSALGYLHYAVGANFAVRRATFQAVGGCDEAFAICGDDIDLSWRIQRSGGGLRFSEDAVMHYRLRPDLQGLARQRYLYGQAEGLLRRKFADAVPPLHWRERWPTYHYLVTRCWHLLADAERRGGWLSTASYCAGRLRGSLRYRVVNY